MRAAKNIPIILAGLLVLILSIPIIQGISGERPHASQTSFTPTETPEAAFTLDIPQKALWRNYAHVSAEATPGSTCDLLYIPPSGKSQELSSVADEKREVHLEMEDRRNGWQRQCQVDLHDRWKK